ncbi:MAG: hypothetical protein ACOH2S_10735 [Janthinobacterium svalbardensis]
MSSLSLYEHYCPGQSGIHGDRQVSIILHGTFNDHEILARSLARHLRANAAPARVVLFGLEKHSQFIAEALDRESAFKSRLEVTWGGAAETNPCFGIVQNLAQNAASRGIGREISQAEVLKELALAATMTAQSIFTQSGCLQHAPHGSHYSKTSKAHCNTFIRTSNALVQSQHTLTLAYFLQKFITQPAKRILIDTSAVASVIYAACHIAVQEGILDSMPIIDSFQSYEGMSDTDLEDVENTLFIISASTSGNLARKAFSKGVKKNQLITLYLLSEDQADQDALCLLQKLQGNPDGVELVGSWNSNECVLCHKGSTPIQIGGDLFLTSLPETASIILIKKHLPEEQRDIITRFAGLRVFRAHRRIGGRTAEISVDLDTAFNDPAVGPKIIEFREEWKRLLRRNLPANISHLVRSDYPFATTLGDGVKSFITGYLNSKINVLSGNQVMASAAVVNGCAIVLSPCVDDPVELMGINRDLRSKIPGGTAVYLFPFIRAKSVGQAKGIVTNLTFGDRGAGTYSLHRMYELYLPDDRAENSWDKELSCIKVLIDWLESIGEDVPDNLAARRKQLNSATAEGLTDALFWPDSAGKALAIRSNFVLLPTEDGQKALDQVDVFVVISALLNNLRETTAAENLRSSQYERKVLSPTNFLRFNDGVIQAALLRAARNGELNYASSNDVANSANMTDHILKMIDKAEFEDGEALTEFLLAIGLGTLRLEERDLNSVVHTITAKLEKMPRFVGILARALEAGKLPIHHSDQLR